VKSDRSEPRVLVALNAQRAGTAKREAFGGVVGVLRTCRSPAIQGFTRQAKDQSRAATPPATSRHPNHSLPLLPSGPGGVCKLSSREDRRSRHKTLPVAMARRKGMRKSGGERGIRTLDTGISRIHTFQACSFNHSDISPARIGNPIPGARTRGAEDTRKPRRRQAEHVLPRQSVAMQTLVRRAVRRRFKPRQGFRRDAASPTRRRGRTRSSRSARAA
jgi:hypothetical protein